MPDEFHLAESYSSPRLGDDRRRLRLSLDPSRAVVVHPLEVVRGSTGWGEPAEVGVGQGEQLIVAAGPTQADADDVERVAASEGDRTH